MGIRRTVRVLLAALTLAAGAGAVAASSASASPGGTVTPNARTWG
jgi:ABC-type glycerol-3-phosphate transport system substrate-binding protein